MFCTCTYPTDPQVFCTLIGNQGCRTVSLQTEAGGPICDTTLSFQNMLANRSPRLRSTPSSDQSISALCGARFGGDDLRDGSVPFHPRHFLDNAVSNSGATDFASSPESGTAKPIPSAPIIGRPRQWTASRSRKLARLYLYSTLSIEQIIRVLENDGFHPRCGNARIRGKAS